MITNREMALLALAALVEGKAKSVDWRQRVEALDAFSASGIGGMRWKRILSSRVKVVLCENDKDTFQRLVENCRDNGFDVRFADSSDEGVCPSPATPSADSGNAPSADTATAAATAATAATAADDADSKGVIAFNEDCNVTMLQRGFDFIHLDPFGSTVHHLDAAFKNVRQGGVVVLTSTDTGSLFGKVPTVAKRNYDGFVVKTEYFRELAARLVLAAAARAAAKCNKGFEVLYVVAMEHFVQATVRILRGAQPADQTLSKVAKIVHCLVCQERSLVPNSNHPVDANDCLICDCPGPSTTTTTTTTTTNRGGRNRILLGPVWCGPIFDARFVEKMDEISHRAVDDLKGTAESEEKTTATRRTTTTTTATTSSLPRVACCAKTKELLNYIKAEALCTSSSSSSAAAASTVTAADKRSARKNSCSWRGEDKEEESNKLEEESADNPKRRRLSQNGDAPATNAAVIMPTASSPAAASAAPTPGSAPFVASKNGLSHSGLRELSNGEPVFYYSTHLHVPKGLELMKVDSLVELLRREGFRASRTHLDSAAVRTDASAAHLRRIFSQHCRTIQPKH